MPPPILSARPPVRQPDWAAAATEARRQRDAAVKLEMAERKQQWREARAWSPPHKILQLKRSGAR